MIISIDEFKKQIEGYVPEKAELFHSQSAKMANKAFDKALKKVKCNNINLLNGGSASGKSEFAITHLEDNNSLTFDSTLSTLEGLKIKINNILKVKKIPIIYSVIPDDLHRAFVAFLHRDRRFDDSHFYRTHSQSRKVLLDAYYLFPDIKTHIIESSYQRTKQGDVLEFKEIGSNDDKLYENYLQKIQMTESDIIEVVNK